MPISKRSWRMLLPLAAFLLLAVLWTIYWVLASNFVKTRVAEERAMLAQNRVSLSCTEESWGGFPFHFELTCSSPVLRWDGPAELKSARVLFTALSYAPWQVVALVDGPSTVTSAGLLPTRIEHQRAIVVATFDRDWKPRLSADIPSLSVAQQGGAAKVLLHARPSKGGTDVAISASEVTYHPAGRPPLTIGQAELVGSLSPERVLSVERVAMEQGTVRYWGNGTASLDVAHRPSGKLDTQTNDLNGLLELLDPHLQLSTEQKAGLRTMLGLLGNEAKAPLIAKEGVLYLGPFRIADLPPLY